MEIPEYLKKHKLQSLILNIALSIVLIVALLPQISTAMSSMQDQGGAEEEQVEPEESPTDVPGETGEDEREAQDPSEKEAEESAVIPKDTESKDKAERSTIKNDEITFDFGDDESCRCTWDTSDNSLIIQPSNAIEPGSFDNPSDFINELEDSGIDYTQLTSFEAKGSLKVNKQLNYMFYVCSEITFVKFSSSFDTSKATQMINMFESCSSLTSLDLSSFNTSSVEYMSSMFKGCSALNKLDISSFATPKLETVDSMFEDCENLTSIVFPKTFDTSLVKNMSNMFRNCKTLTSLDVSNFKTSKVT
ncbi:MAG: BspA family leucine-rich repeat surface protein, partial [Streptococcus gallolyticus]|nr:BspA family leucine-rich repeat surface protein [Streptococcus gallolyticus]